MEKEIMLSISWHQARLNDRIFARKRENGPWYSGHLTKIGNQGGFVTIAWDEGGCSKRHFNEVFYPKELFKRIDAGEATILWINGDAKEKSDH